MAVPSLVRSDLQRLGLSKIKRFDEESQSFVSDVFRVLLVCHRSCG